MLLAMLMVVMQIVFEALRKTGGDTSSKALAKALDNTNLEGFLGNFRFSDARVGVGQLFYSQGYKGEATNTGQKYLQSIP